MSYPFLPPMGDDFIPPIDRYEQEELEEQIREDALDEEYWRIMESDINDDEPWEDGDRGY